MAAMYNHLHFPSHSEHGNGSYGTQDTVLNLFAYINQEFEVLGLPVLSLESPSKVNSDVIFLMNRFQDVFNLYHKVVRVKDDVQNRNHRLLCDLEHNQSIHVHLKQKTERAEKEMHQEKEKCRQYIAKCKQMSNKLRAEMEEVKRLKMALQSRDSQHKHELNKKEKEINKLKERLHQLLADKVPDRKVGMDLMSLVSGNDGRRATWKTKPGKREEETYQILIDNYEVRHQELMEENGELRDCLLSLKRELSALLKNSRDISGMKTSKLSAEGDVYDSIAKNPTESPQLNVAALDQGHFQLPVDIMRHQVEQSFKVTCEEICQIMIRWHSGRRASVDDSPSKPARSGNQNSSTKDNPDKKKSSSDRRNFSIDTSEIEKLKRQIGSYKSIIQQQEDLIKQTLAAPSQAKECSFMHESPLVKERETLSHQKKLFSEEKTNFDKERTIFTEAAIRLAKERKVFEEERAALLKQHFLNISPFKQGNSKPKGEGQSNRLLPATPVFSPAKSKHNKDTDLPSTPELFEILGLSSGLKSSPRKESIPSTLVDMNLSFLESPRQTSSNNPAAAHHASPEGVANGRNSATDLSTLAPNIPYENDSSRRTTTASSALASSISPENGSNRRRSAFMQRHFSSSQSSISNINDDSSATSPTVEDIKASLMAKSGHK